MRRSSRCRRSCAHGSPAEGASALPHTSRFSIMAAPHGGQPPANHDTPVFPGRGEMAERSKAHPC